VTQRPSLAALPNIPSASRMAKTVTKGTQGIGTFSLTTQKGKKKKRRGRKGGKS
jgi:hypothetical protein